MRYAIDENGYIHRFFTYENDKFHWSGSTGDKRAPYLDILIKPK